MSLMHCNDACRIGKLLASAVHLTEPIRAHLIALSVVPPGALIQPERRFGHRSSSIRIAG
jgi:hypothetical protein